MNIHPKIERAIKVVLLLAATLLFSAVATAATEIGDDQYIIFYHNDALGSPVVVTDHNGNTLWHEHSDPYGKIRDRVMPTGKEIFHDQTESRKGYTGHLKDFGSDLVYMKARYYDPVIGRFYSNDPVGFTASNPMMFNRYAYANNNPYKYVDPDGQFIDTVFDFGQTLYETGQALAAGAAVVVGHVTGDEALRDIGVEAFKSEGADVVLAAAGFLAPGVPSAGLLAAKKGLKNVPKGGDDFVDGYRAVSKAEADDIAQHGLRPNPNGRSMEDKWFSESREGAEKFKQNYGDLDEVVEVRVPRDVYDRSHKVPNIDNTGPGFCVSCNDLGTIQVK